MYNQGGGNTAGEDDLNPSKKSKIEAKESAEKLPKELKDLLLDQKWLHAVLKRVDARTLAVAACVNTHWKRVAQDERLWELMCIKDGSRNQQWQMTQQQLRSVVLALGGFRRLYSLHLWPLVKLSSSSSTSSSSSLPSSTWRPCLPE